ncbi:MAG: glycosyltransferase family 2 protein [Myxococcales bacterium]|nr:glycosyltransferase family 2 protein [Myxococcales bacterium]
MLDLANRSSPGGQRALAPHGEAVRLVLCMIVRNEARVIARCLHRALPIADGFVIADTGSRDGTIAAIETLVADYGVPGRLLRQPFRNFGHNRTLVAREARQWVSDQGWPLERTYLLLLDADMVLHVCDGFDKNALDGGSYQVVQDDGQLRYFNTRLVCLAHEWQARGPTHEYWEAVGGGASNESLGSLWIEDLGDGGSKRGKFTRDILLLRQGLASEPQNPRYAFYLAQSYFDSGRLPEAASWYARRWKMGGWDEERWYARYRHGLCQLHRGNGRQGADLLLRAFDERPGRAEPLCVLAQYYREQGHHRAAMMLALRALSIPYPDHDLLFIEKQVYDWRLWQEIMICAYYAGDEHHELGLSACERLQAQRGHEPWFYNYVRSNEVFYLESAPRQCSGGFELEREQRCCDGIEFLTTNPSVTRHAGRVIVNLRLLNYHQDGGRQYEPYGLDAFVTYNAPFVWHPEAACGDGPKLVYGIPEDWPAQTSIRGLEDVRLLSHGGELWFTAACNQVPGSAGRCRVVLGRYNATLDAVEHLVPLQYEGATDYEKNWLPWSCDGQLRIIYSYDPLVVLAVDTETGECEVAQRLQTPFHARDLRGSAGPQPIPGRPGRWLALVHEVASRESGNVYLHRWIEVDSERGLLSRSRPFFFDEASIEYAAGFCSLDDERLLLTYGHQDREARWLTTCWSDVLASLRTGEPEASAQTLLQARDCQPHAVTAGSVS